MAATHFSSEIQSKRIDKGRVYAELQLLSQLPPSFKVTHTESPFGMTLRVEIAKDLLPGLEIDSVSFDVLLEGSYPFQAPKVLCNTSFIRPSLADGRDLLRDIIDAQWSPSLTMNQMIPQLPAFVFSLSQLSDLGTLHLGHPMRLSIWADLEHVKSFECQDLDIESSPPRIMIVTEVAILLLEPSMDHRDYAHLYSWANFQSIERITTSRQYPGRLTFHWKAIGDTAACKQTLNVSRTSDCLEAINGNMQRLGITEESSQYIAEEEVTAVALQKVHIQELLQEVEMYEGYIKVRENPESTSKLLNLYQQVIEYYSAMGDERFGEYLRKMRALFQKGNEDTEA